MFGAGDDVADIVHVASDLGQFALAHRIPEPVQHLPADRTDQGGVTEAVLGEALRTQVLVRLA
jgi:hypothetical protein